MEAQKTRWEVRLCPEHGVQEHHSRGFCCVGVSNGPPGTWCGRELSEPFGVVRAVGARTSDPDTSKLAALQHEPRKGTQRARVLAEIRVCKGGLTARQVTQLTGIEGAWKRVSELKQGGHVVIVGQRLDLGNMADVYAVPRPSYKDPDD